MNSKLREGATMTKELREDVDRIIRDVNMAADSRVDEILALFDRYAADREQLERKRHVLIEGGLRQELNEIKNAIRVLAALQGEE